MHPSLEVIKDYYRLTKPGIIQGNILTATGGFLLASRGDINVLLLLAVIAGTALIIASACVFNNIKDQDIDARMERTRGRALVIGNVSDEAAWTYGAVLGCIGGIILLKFTNTATVVIGLVGFISYVYLYTAAKRRTVHATLLGSIPGATPVAAGYIAVTGAVDLGAILLFIIMVFWQMPHFYSIAIFRKAEYAAAAIPVLPVVRGVPATRKQIIYYMLAFTAAAASLAVYGYASFSYFVIMLLVSAWWLYRAYTGVPAPSESDADTGEVRWARQLFKASLVVLVAWSVLLLLDAWLP